MKNNSRSIYHVDHCKSDRGENQGLLAMAAPVLLDPLKSDKSDKQHEESMLDAAKAPQ